MPNIMIQLANCEEAFAISPIPIWIVHIESCRILWANSPAIDFWQADSFEELAGRDMLRSAPAPVLIRLQQAFDRIKIGDVFQEDWTFFPKGKPKHIVLHLRPVRLPDGSIGMLNHATYLDETASPSISRALAMLHHARSILTYVDSQGKILNQTALSISEFERVQDWTLWLEHTEIAEEILQKALSGQTVQAEVAVKTSAGKRIHSIVAHELRDPVAGELGVLIQHFDVTDRVHAEKLIQVHLARLQEQNEEIRKLSTPFLDVGAHTLALPIIGRIDEPRAKEIASRLFEMVIQRNIKTVILDLTGVELVEGGGLTFIRRLVDGVRLLGAQPIVTGIRAGLARLLATSNESLSGVTVKRSLADGLADWRSDQANWR